MSLVVHWNTVHHIFFTLEKKFLTDSSRSSTETEKDISCGYKGEEDSIGSNITKIRDFYSSKNGPSVHMK